MKTGKVWLVGAGPGDAGLLTVKARKLIQDAEFIAFDALISDEILCLLPEETEKVSVGKRSGKHSISQEEINHLLLEKAQEGKRVLRLKGGDPFVFGRGGEELELLAEHEISFEFVPGVTAAVAVPAYAGIPVTHRDFASSFHVITGHTRSDGKERIDYAALVHMDATLVFLMGLAALGNLMDQLMRHGMAADMPAAVMERGTLCGQRSVISTVGQLEADSKAANVQTPAMIVVGKVCSLASAFAWYDKRPLAGRKILVTRSRTNASRLSESLRDKGAQVLEVPMIKSRNLPPKQVDLRGLLDHSRDRQMWLGFTSPFSVQSFLQALEGKGLDLRQILSLVRDVRFAAVGSATAKKLREIGWQADVVPEESNGLQMGRALVEQADANAIVYLLRARNGEREILDELNRGGLAWQDIPTYETISRENSWMSTYLREQMEAASIDCATFSSASTVRGFVQTMRGLDFTKVWALCIGDQTAAEAEKYGMKITVSDHASIDSMIDKIMEIFSI